MPKSRNLNALCLRNKTSCMPHNGTSTNNESDASERQNQQRQNPQEKDSRSQHKLKTYSSPLCPAQSSSSTKSGVPESSLFTNGFCKWPGCNEVFKEYTIFLKHLRTEHGPGDKSIAQWRMQSDIVQHMENQLAVEKQKLREMHLHLLGIRSTLEDDSLEQSSHLSESLQQCQGINGLPSASRDSTELLARGYWHLPTSQLIPGVAPSIECYKYTNIRPPFTYASMIRWAILESPEKQLTLNEIYHWFTRMFFYFRHNTATWKNAVRHNLSLHKCFVRVEGGKGSVWTVDEVEFLKRKGQKLHRDHDFTWMAHYPFFYT
ncbi:forkhead box protein P3-like [Chanos chanos]|uniref:Forkhead box protein P3-like n=1 Tax=Chanos chanos TaxID=29144 RepID=A0A6J2W9U8_CHACN|nr:forkhead box protein P3-like [Chanos chanos]